MKTKKEVIGVPHPQDYLGERLLINNDLCTHRNECNHEYQSN